MVSKVQGNREGGLALLSVLVVLLVLMVISSLLLVGVTRELQMALAHEHQARALAAAETGATVARAALLAYLGNVPGARAQFVGAIESVMPSVAANDDPLRVFNYLRVNGQGPLVHNPVPNRPCPFSPDQAPFIEFHVNFSRDPYLKLQLAPADNDVPGGSGQRYRARVRVYKLCGPNGRSVEPASSFEYTMYLRYEIIAEGQSGAFTSRVVRYARGTPDDPVIVKVTKDSFARYALFTFRHTGWRDQGDPGDPGQGIGDVWFTSDTVWYGPVHTNEYFRIYRNPRFYFGEVSMAGATSLPCPDPEAGGDPLNYPSDRRPHFHSSGRVDADAVPPDVPQFLDGAVFKRGPQAGVPCIALPANVLAQARAAFGGDPYRDDPVTPEELFEKLGFIGRIGQQPWWRDSDGDGLPELRVFRNNSCSDNQQEWQEIQVPPDFYARPNDELGGRVGFYVHNDLDLLSMRVENGEQVFEFRLRSYDLQEELGLSGNRHFRDAGDTCQNLSRQRGNSPVVVRVNYTTATTRVEVPSGLVWWYRDVLGLPVDANGRATFNAVPVGLVYVGQAHREQQCKSNWSSGCRGHVLDLRGPGRPGPSADPVTACQSNPGWCAIHAQTQFTVFAQGDVRITSDLVYQSPPDPNDPNSNPPNILGVYSHANDIVLWDGSGGTQGTPNSVVLHGVFMASGREGQTGVVTARAYDTRPAQGQARLLGGVIQSYYGPFGRFNSSTGQLLHGYYRDFRYDTRLMRGLAPPFFPTLGRWKPVPERAGAAWRWCETVSGTGGACLP
ncbi:MAG: DUF4900 domain-containing protein [Armatimonadota bacterium]|nr:DUF4900 domain-containing protein [Armatimonadota bacterium]